MSNRPLVSIIMPVYKTEEYIEETMKSVLAQTYDRIELLCVNDCTPDGAFEICKQYNQQYPWMKLLENEKNSGVEFTRNHGLDKATGEYVLFLDSDDLIRPEMVERMVSTAEENQPDIVMAAYSTYTLEQDVPVLANINPPAVMDMVQFSELLLDRLEWKILCCIGTKLYRRAVIESNRLRFDKKYRYNEDGAFILSFLLHCERVSYIDEAFYQYRIRQSGSSMSSYQKDRFLPVSKASELLKDLFLQNHIFDQKKTLYYKKLMFVMIDSLKNEARYGSKESFRRVRRQIQSYPDYAEMKKQLLHSKLVGKKQKIFLWCLHFHFTGLLYRLL